MPLEEIVQNMIDANEPEETIATVIEEYGKTDENGLVIPKKQVKLKSEEPNVKKTKRKIGDVYNYRNVPINIGTEDEPLYKNIWKATTINKYGDEEEIVIDEFDEKGNPNIPKEHVEFVQKDLRSKKLADLSISDALESIRPNTYEEKEKREELTNDIQEDYDKLLDYRNNVGLPEKPSEEAVSLPTRVMVPGPGGEMMEVLRPEGIEAQYTSEAIKNWENQVSYYNNQRNTFMQGGFAKSYKSAEKRLKEQEKLTGKKYTADDVLKEIENERYIDWRTKYIKDQLTKKFEGDLDWGDTAWSIFDVGLEKLTSGILDIDTEDLPEDQQIFLKNLQEHYKKYGTKRDIITSAPVLSKQIKNKSQELNLLHNFIKLNVEDLKAKEQELSDYITTSENIFTPLNEKLKDLEPMKDVVETLNNLQVQLDSYSDIAIDGKLVQEDYTDYEKIHKEYTALYKENKSSINDYYNTVEEYNTASEEYNKPYEDITGKVWKNKGEYLVSSYNISLNDLKAKSIVFNEQSEALNSFLEEDDKDLALYTNMAKRDYRNIVQWDRYMKTSLVNLISGAESAVHAVLPATLIENGLKEYYGPKDPFTGEYSENVPDIVKSFFAIRDWQNQPREKVKAAINELTANWMSGVQERTNWHNIENSYDWGEYILGASADFAPQLGMMIAMPQASLYILAASSGGNKYDQMVKENKFGAGYSMFDIYFASTITGLGEYWTEKVTLGLIKKTGIGLEGIKREGFKKGMQKLVSPKNIGYGVLDIGVESLSEVGAKMTENFGDIVAGKNISIYEGVNEAGFNGLVMSGHIKAPLLFKRMVVPFLPKEDGVILEENTIEMLDINKQMEGAEEGSETMIELEGRLNDILAQNNSILSRTVDRVNGMTAEEKRIVMDADILRHETKELIDNILKDETIPVDQKKELIEKAKNDFYKANKKASEAIKEAQIRMDTEAAKKALVKAGVVEEGNYTTIEDVEDFQTQYEELSGKTDNRRNSDAVIIQQEDGTTFVLLNKTRQKQVNSVSAASHDTFHGIINATINGPGRIVKNPQGEEVEVDLTKEGFELMKDFKNSLSRSERALVQKRIDDNYRYKRDPITKKFLKDEDGKKIENAEEEYAEEYMTSYVDILRKELVKPSGISLFNIAGLYQKYFEGKGYENLEFKSGQDIKTLIQDYTKDIKSGEVRQAILDIAGPGGATIGTVKASETIDDSTVNEDVQTIRRRRAQAEKIAKERGVTPPVDPLTRRAEGRVIEAIKDPVGKITQTLTKALYDPIAIEARSGISRSEYVESLKAELNNMVINEWDITKQDVEKHIVNKGWLRAQSLAKRLGIESVEEFEGKGIMKRGEDIDTFSRRNDNTEFDFDAARKEVRRQLDNDEISVERADELMQQIAELENDKPGQELETGKVRKILDIKENSVLYKRVLQGVKNELKDIDFDNLLLDRKSQKKLRQILDKGFTHLFKGEVAKILGTQKSDKLRKLLTAKQKPLQRLLGVKYTTRFKGENSLVEKVKDKMGVQESADAQASLEGSFVMSETAGNDLWGPKKLTTKQFVDIFVEGRETQYKSLVNALANELGLDAVFHPDVLPESAVKHTAKISEAIKRNPSVKLSETISEELTPEELIRFLNVDASVIAEDAYEVLKLAVLHDYKSPDFYKALQEAGINEEALIYLDSQDFGDYFQADVSGFKKPLQQAMRKGEFSDDVVEMLDVYFVDVMNETNATAKKQLVKSMMDLIDILEPEVVAVLPPQMFGLTGSDRLLGGKNFKFPELKKKYENKKNQKPSGKNLGFDPSKVRILNANQGLMLKIQNVLAQPFDTWKDKKNEVREKYGKEIDDANTNNPIMLKHLAKAAHSLFTKNIDGVGVLRWYEAATSNVLAQRGLTTLSTIQYYAKSQAPYIGRNKDGEIIKYFAKKPARSQIPKKVTIVEINKKHPDYKVAESIARYRAQKTAKKKGYDKKWVNVQVELIVGEHLRFKGEHIDPSANVMREISILSLKIRSGQNLDFSTEYDIITANFAQSLGVEAYSKLQDIKLGTTSELGDMRILSIEKDANINSFRTSDDIAIQTVGYVQRKFTNLEAIEGVKNSIINLNPTPVKVINNINTLKKARVKASESIKEPQGLSAWDFDDTIARTKSGVRYTLPNPEGTPQPGRKVIFMAGGPGSGKSTVINGLDLKNQGFKVVNQDISLEWLMKNHGLPTDMKDFTPEQASKFGSLGWDARMIAKRKQAKYQGKGDGIIVDGTGNSLNVMKNHVQEFKNKGYDVQMVFVETSLETALERNRARKERSLRDGIVKRTHESVQNNKEAFKELFGNNFAEVKTDNLKIGDSMPQSIVSKLDNFTKGYIKGRLSAEEFANEGANILEQGGEFDFTEFDIVKEGEKGPLFGKAMDRAKKYGLKDNYILTARPHAAKMPIFRFLQARGLNIPFDNIITLENSTAEAKALWIAEKVGEGYNDIYFADDAIQNIQAVQNMLDQFDIKGKTQQAKVKFSETMNEEFNNILEDVTGIESKKRFSAIKARKRGADKGKFRFFIPPSHEDFVGLLYNFIGKGRKGDAHRDFFEQALIRPLNRAYRELNTAKQAIANDYKSLNKEFKNVKNKLTKKTPDGDFTYQDAIRVYLFDKHGYEIPGLNKTDQQKLVDLVMADSELQIYAETLNIISKQDTYVNPTERWEVGDIRTDLDAATGRVGRASYFIEFFENTDIIFSKENLNKIEATYGADVVSAIKDILYRTKTGRNRPSGQNAMVNTFMNYLNGSVASTMFFNMRSAVLQQMSMVNFINFADNNVYAAAKAFVNQKQYWTDWAFIFNSDFMKQRRGGIKTDVNGAELAASLRGAKNTPRALLAKLLELGFLPTQIGDNMAIATGGATFYRNRINTYLKQGLSQEEAESKAWIDFQILAEATQQSARPDMVSQQQASPLGKVILAFQNVTSQFNRLGKKAFLDIKNRRITPGNTTQFQSDISNMSRITYYFAIQNLIFYSLQSALFLALFEDDEDDDKWLKKRERVINGSIDSVLRGTGVWGAVVATLKNMAIKFHEQRGKGYNADESSVLMEMLNVSPPLGIKARKIVNAEKTLNYNKDVIKEMETFDIDNPMWSAVTNIIEATTNAPTNRMYNKTQNTRQSLDNQNAAYQRVLMFGGWSQYNLDIENEKIGEIKEEAKIKKKKIRKIETERKKVEKEVKQEKVNEAQQKKEKKEGKKEIKCIAVTKDGRCGLPVIPGKKYCTVHQKVKQREDGKEVKCKAVRTNGEPCNMMTTAKSGYCVYHD